jgi:hypothetical protein
MLINAIYEALQSVFHGQWQDAALIGGAAAIAVLIVVLPTRHLLHQADHTNGAFG